MPTIDALPTPRRMYLPATDGAVFCVLHEPSVPAGGRAVVLVGPFGWEDMCAFRPLREWARRLAGAGHVALRLDLPGTGDSAGSPRDPDRFGAWSRGVAEAAAFLRSTTPATAVTLVGIGLGGLVACQALADGAPADELVLWGVPGRGRRLVRELRAFSRLERAGDEGPPGEARAAGYVMTAETAAAIEAFDVTRLRFAGGRPGRALLLERDGMAVDGGLRAALAAADADVTVAPGPGYGAMTAEPHESVAPAETIERVLAWLGTVAPGAVAPGTSQARDEALLAVDGTPVRERPVVLARGTTGILAAPADDDPARAGLAVVLLNAGAQRRTGPNRMWVEAARRWAADGVPSLRLDFTSLGDADGPEEPWPDERVHDPVHVTQLGEAFDALQEAGVASRFAVVGLCSGAYWTLHGALADERVVGGVMINPRAVLWHDGMQEARTVRKLRRLTRPATLWHIVTGRVPLRAGVEVLRAVFSRLRGRAAAPDADAVGATFDRLRERGVPLTLAFTAGEPLHYELRRDGHLDRLDRWPNLHVEEVAGPVDVHTLQPASVQRDVHALLDRWLADERARHAPAATAAPVL